MKLSKKYIGALLISGMVFSTSCNSWNNTAKGGAIGAGSGAALGGIIGKKSGNTAEGAILGAAIGGVTGAAIGRYMDKQKEDIEKDLGNSADVQRVGEGILVTFESGILFGFDSDDLNAEVKHELDNFSETLREYSETDLVIQGYTDSVGSEDYNLDLSKERAQSVQNYLSGLGIETGRMMVEGLGESNPVASNDTPEGREKNRRVEIAIFANDELKQKAETGEI
ncbi:OmpA family protein [Chondrinema litorale]|uniref:OmpA family protein n=1 Tax=Chondrinema litorale TaxID=2994555 RepID=UPI00254376B2|nr:OmpA family protein [Chondrinema litorale]UZR98881.1 OmpA family protein [Chondrinema litorale]